MDCLCFHLFCIVDGVYRILYEEVDESDVHLYKFPSTHPTSTEYEEYRFPRAGTPNAKSKLKLVQFEISTTLKIDEICVKDMHNPLTYYFPWMEYIVRIGWTPDSKSVWAQLLNRQQNRLDLVLIPLDNFCDVSSPNASNETTLNGAIVEHSWQSTLNKQISPIQVIWSQTSATWINVHDLFEFIEMNETHVTFIWASEETGFRHLYLVTSQIQRVTDSCVNGAHNDEQSILPVPHVISKIALTSGDWEVLGRNLWIDQKRQLVYFMGLRESPLEKHLYVVSLTQPSHVRLLTRPGFSYSVEFNEDCSVLVQVYCNIHHLPSCGVYHIVDTNELHLNNVNNIEMRTIGYLFEGGLPQNVQLQRFSPSIYSRHLESGDLLYAMVFKPHNFKPGFKYPTVLNVYGGPEVQTVNNTFKVQFIYNYYY